MDHTRSASTLARCGQALRTMEDGHEATLKPPGLVPSHRPHSTTLHTIIPRTVRRATWSDDACLFDILSRNLAATLKNPHSSV